MLNGLLIIFWGTVTALLVYFFFTKIWLNRGRVLWAWLGSLISLAISLCIGQFTLAYKYYQAFSRIGPCSICYEWSGFPFFFYLVGWGIGGLIFLILAWRATANFTRRGEQIIWGLPRQAAVWFVALTVIAISGTTYFVISRSQQRADLIEAKQGLAPLPVMEGMVFTPLGSLDLPWTLNQAWRGQPHYVEFGSLHLSPDNNWLTVGYSHKFEIWDREFKPALQIELPRYDYLIRSAFSPDASTLALWKNTCLEAYTLKENSISLLWQVELQVYHYVALTFAENGTKLILVIPNEVRVYDTLTGTLLAQNALPTVEGYFQIVFSPTARYIARWNKTTVEVFDQYGKHRVQNLTTPIELNYSPAQQELLSFLDEDRLMFIHPYGGQEDMSIEWDLQTGGATLFPVNASGGSRVIYSPDRYLMLTSGYGGGFSVWETTGYQQLKTVPTSATITDMTFSPDQTLLVIATANGKLHFYSGALR